MRALRPHLSTVTTSIRMDHRAASVGCVLRTHPRQPPGLDRRLPGLCPRAEARPLFRPAAIGGDVRCRPCAHIRHRHHLHPTEPQSRIHRVRAPHAPSAAPKARPATPRPLPAGRSRSAASVSGACKAPTLRSRDARASPHDADDGLHPIVPTGFSIGRDRVRGCSLPHSAVPAAGNHGMAGIRKKLSGSGLARWRAGIHLSLMQERQRTPEPRSPPPAGTVRNGKDPGHEESLCQTAALGTVLAGG